MKGLLGPTPGLRAALCWTPHPRGKAPEQGFGPGCCELKARQKDRQGERVPQAPGRGKAVGLGQDEGAGREHLGAAGLMR